MSDRIEVWQLQASWAENVKGSAGPSRREFAAGAVQLQCRESVARATADRMLGDVVAKHPAAFDLQVHAVRGSVGEDDHRGFVGGGVSFTVESEGRT